jgi:hypothetical protein
MGHAHATPSPTKSEAMLRSFGIVVSGHSGDHEGCIVSRTLNDDFDDDDLPGGQIDLEKGSQVGSGVTSSYDGGGVDFDDDFGDAPATASLELDMPHHSNAPAVPDLALRSTPPQQQGQPAQQRQQPQQPPSVSRAPAAPQPPASGAALQALTSRSIPAAHPSSSPSGAIPPAPPSSDPNYGAPPSSVSSMHGLAGSPIPQARPSAGSVIAKYPPPPAKIWEAPIYAFKVVMRQFELRSDLESLRRRRSPDVPLYESALGTYDKKTFRLGMAISCAIFAVLTFIFFLPVILRFMRAD